jgi:hypothetical protein
LNLTVGNARRGLRTCSFLSCACSSDVGGAGTHNWSSWSSPPQRQRLEIPQSGFVPVDGLWLGGSVLLASVPLLNRSSSIQMSGPMSKKQLFGALFSLLICAPSYAGTTLADKIARLGSRTQTATDLPTRRYAKNLSCSEVRKYHCARR